jgi:hypothetical protein
MRIELHLGIHKTATTHLQRYWMNGSRLAAARAVCPPLADVRARITPVCNPPSREPDEDEARRASAVVWLLQWHGKGRSVILSDENVVGSCERVFAQRMLYAEASQRLERLASLLRGHDVRVWLSVRDYGAFLSSAYCETLRHGPYRPFRQAYSGLELPLRGWEHLAQDIRQAFPRAELRCWRYESLPLLLTSLSSEVLGLPIDGLPKPDEQRDRRSLSRMAIRLLDDIHERVGVEEATRVRPSVERVVVGSAMPPFDPWDDAERAQLVAAYAQSLAALRAMPGVTWLG